MLAAQEVHREEERDVGRDNMVQSTMDSWQLDQVSLEAFTTLHIPSLKHRSISVVLEKS